MASPADLLANRLRRVQDTARTTRASVTRTKPPVRIDLGPNLPAWTLRLACLLLGALAIVLLAPAVVPIVVLAITVLLVAVRPGASTGAVFCAVLGLFWMLTPSPPNSFDQFALLAIGPLIWTAAGACHALPLRTKIEWRTLQAPALRYLIIQLISQPLLVGATLLQTGGPNLAGPLAGLIAFGCAIAIAVGAWLILPTLKR